VQSTDNTRANYVNGVEITVDPNVAGIFAKVQKGQLGGSMIDPPPAVTTQQYLRSPQLSGYFHSDPINQVEDVTMNLDVPPFTDVHVRKAVAWVLDKSAMLRALGGTSHYQVAGVDTVVQNDLAQIGIQIVHRDLSVTTAFTALFTIKDLEPMSALGGGYADYTGAYGFAQPNFGSAALSGPVSCCNICWLRMLDGRVQQYVDGVNWPEIAWHLPLVSMDTRAGFHSEHWRWHFAHPITRDPGRGVVTDGPMRREIMTDGCERIRGAR